MSSNRSDPAPQYRLKPGCCPSCCKGSVPQDRVRSGDRSRRLTYAERVAQQYGGLRQKRDARPRRAQTISAVIQPRPLDSHCVDQNSDLPQRATTVRRKRAHQDLRSASNCSKPLPAVPAGAACERSSSKGDSQHLEESHSSRSEQHESEQSKLDELVRSVKDIAGRCKSRCGRYTREVRLSMAWEVEEMI